MSALDVEEGAQLAESHAKFANSRDRATLIGWADRLRGGVDRRTIEHLDRFVTVARRAIRPRVHASTTPPRPYGSIARSPVLGVVRAVPAVGVAGPDATRHARRRHRPVAVHRGDGLRRPLPAADPPDRDDATARAATTRTTPTPGDPGQPVGDRWRRGWPHRRASRARHRRRCRTRSSTAARTHDVEVALDLAFQTSPDHPWVTRAPGSGSVTAPTARSRTPRTRRSGTRTSTRSTSTTADRDRPLEGAARRRPLLDRARRPRLPCRQPAHEAVRVLGVADRVRPRDRSRRDLPRRGLHPARGHGAARQARLHAVVHVLHVAQREVGARPSTSRELSDPAAPRLLPAQRLAQHARHPPRVVAAGHPGDVHRALPARRRAQRELRDLRTGVRAAGTHRARSRAARSTSTRRSTRCGTGTSNAPTACAT